MKTIIEKTGTGIEQIERTGTGIEKTGTGIERTGTGMKRAGTGIERTGTGIKSLLFALVCASTFFGTVTIAAPVVNHVGALTITSTDDVITVSWHKAVDTALTIIVGSAALSNDYVSIRLYSFLGVTDFDKVLGNGTGASDKVLGNGTGGSSIGDGSEGLMPWGEMELTFNEDGSIEGIISRTSQDQGYEEFVFKAGGDMPFLVPVFGDFKN